MSVGLKDSGARPLRAWLTVLTLAVTVMAIIATLSIERTVSEITADPARIGDPFDLAIDPGKTPRPVVESALRDRRVASWYTATDRRGAVGGATFHVRVLGGDVARSGFVVRSGDMIRGPGDAIVGYGLLHDLGLSVGDRFSLAVSGGRLDLRSPVGTRSRRTAARSPRSPSAPCAGWSGMPTPVAISSGWRRVPIPPPCATPCWPRPGAPPRSTWSTGAQTSSTPFRVAFLVVSLLVLAVALVNLLGTTLVGIRERLHDIGILKTVGFTPRQLGVSVAAGGAAYALAAIAIGVPSGLLAAAAMHDAVGRATGIGPGFGSAPAVDAVLVSGALVVAASSLLAAVAARRAARAQVADILRSE